MADAKDSCQAQVLKRILRTGELGVIGARSVRTSVVEEERGKRSLARYLRPISSFFESHTYTGPSPTLYR